MVGPVGAALGEQAYLCGWGREAPVRGPSGQAPCPGGADAGRGDQGTHKGTQSRGANLGDGEAGRVHTDQGGILWHYRVDLQLSGGDGGKDEVLEQPIWR